MTNKAIQLADTFRYSYDPGGWLVTRWQPGDITTTYRYDPVNNLTNVDYPGSTMDVVLRYDSLNRLTSMVDRVGTTSFTWTGGDQLTSEDGPWISDTVTYAMNNRLRGSMSVSQPNNSVAVAIDEYLKSLKPVPSPYLENGGLSPLAEQGKAAFYRAGCATCHPPPLFTDRHAHNVGTHNSHDKPADKFDTPTLIEVWRTAPYLHDGSAVTIREVITRRNPKDQHGKTSILTSDEIDALCAYVFSL